MFIENLVIHTKRGMESVIRDGRHAGGRAYGYRPVAGKPGEMQIIEAEAEIVRRIFSAYVDGATPNAITAQLNAERIAPPRGSFWRPSALLGSKSRGHGILQNPIYAGRIVWNRVKIVKDPATGRRISRVNPANEWQRADAPHLRIVAEDGFQGSANARRVQRCAEDERDVDRLVDAIADGIITKEEARQRMPALRSDLQAAKAAIDASEEPPKVVTMHPRVVDQYLADLDRLDQLIADNLAAGDDGLAKALREIVTSVTVLPASARQAPEIRIEGYLETLMKQSIADRSPTGVRGPRHR